MRSRATLARPSRRHARSAVGGVALRRCEGALEAAQTTGESSIESEELMDRLDRRTRVEWIVGAVMGVAAFVSAAAGGKPAPSGVRVFDGARVIFGDDRPPVDNATLVVRGARFDAVGKASEVRAPAGAARVS